MMKNKTFFLFFLLSVTMLFAQKSQTVKSDWVVTQENKQVRISSRIMQFDDVKNGMHMEYMQFKYQNKTSHQLFVSCYFDAKYQNEKVSNLDDENYRALLLEPNQTFIPKFLELNEKMHFVFKRFMNYNDKPELLTISLVKLKTNIIK